MNEIKILSGNELLIQGGLEAGFSLYTGYPGSPVADFFNILHHKKSELQSKGIRVVIANSEANAAAMASGAKMAGQDCLVAMKSMGLHVAADALSVGNFADPGDEFKNAEGEKPGVVIAVGDDPWSISTSTPADSRYLFKHLHIPFLEPSTPQELKDWMGHALTLSRRSSVYVGILLTTFMAEGGGSVELGEEVPPQRPLVELDPNQFDLSKNVMVPPNSLAADHRMIKERFPQIKEVLAELNLDQIFGKQDAKIGFISSGLTFEYLKQLLEDHELLSEYSLYKTASSYLLNQDQLLPFLQGLETLIVVEEKRGFLEQELSAFCQEHSIQLKVYGKKFADQEGFPAQGGLDYPILLSSLKNLFNDHLAQAPSWRELTSRSLEVAKRLPTFCPGCPHRETLSLLKDLRRTFAEKGVNLISHGDVGCYSLSFLEPFKEMHDLSAMGQGGAMAAGTDLFAENPSIVLMGDSTFFHSGISAISNSVQCGHDITYILLDNDNTAMTGHQMTPRTGMSVEGFQRPRQDMLKMVKAIGVAQAEEVNPSDRYFYKNLLSEIVQTKGTKVIISNKECALTYHGRLKRKERKELKQGKTLSEKTFFQINPDVCEDCRVCVEETGCPGLTQMEDAYGTKVSIDPNICVADSYCTKIKACPSFEEVVVKDYHPTQYATQKQQQQFQGELQYPSLKIQLDEIKAGKELRIVVIGVGGSGVTTISRILAEASRKTVERGGLEFKFVDQKGLAQRNGSVTAHLSLYKKGKSQGATTPPGSADLILSPDLLEGARALPFLSPEGILVVDKTYQMPLSLLLDKGEEEELLTEDKLLVQLAEMLKSQLHFDSFKDLCADRLGKSVYASACLLGKTFQEGLLPFSLEDLQEAIRNSVPADEVENNLLAFELGRQLVAGLKFSKDKEENLVESYRHSLMESCTFLTNKGNLRKKFEFYFKALGNEFPYLNKNYLAKYVHDILIYDRGKHLEEFFLKAKQLKAKFEDRGHLKIALRVLAKTYWIKDEIFVSHLLASPLSRERNERNYSSLGSSYKVMNINRPRFDIGPWKLEFDLNPRPWMFKIMRHMRILRNVLIGWHTREKEIALSLRGQLFKVDTTARPEQIYKALMMLDNVKGYREVRYQAYGERLGEPLA